LLTQVLANREATSDVDWSRLWIGQRFSHAAEPPSSRVARQFSFKKSIIPTAHMWQMGLHMSGACHLPFPWNGCPAPAPDAPAKANASTSFCFLRDTAFGKDAVARAAKAGGSADARASPGGVMDFDPRLNSVGRPRRTHAFDEMVVEEDTRVVDPETEVRAHMQWVTPVACCCHPSTSAWPVSARLPCCPTLTILTRIVALCLVKIRA